MSDVAASPKKAAPKAKKPTQKADHPPVASMVNAAITSLKDRKGSSLAAIKKYLASTYKVDTVKLAPFIRRYLKKAVADGKLNQVKGSGASGSFKIAKTAAEDKPKKVTKAKKPAVAKKPAATKKSATKKSPKKATKKPAAKKVKTPKKEKKAKKPATAKPKKPATKKAATKSPKKAAKKPAKKASK